MSPREEGWMRLLVAEGWQRVGDDWFLAHSSLPPLDIGRAYEMAKFIAHETALSPPSTKK